MNWIRKIFSCLHWRSYLLRPLGEPVEREAFAGKSDLHDFVVEIEAGGAGESDLFVAAADFQKAAFSDRLEESAVGPVVMGDLIGQYMDEPRARRRAGA